MEISEAPHEALLEQSRKKKYEVEGTGVTVGWKLFEPKETPQPQEKSKSDKTVVFLPGWSITEQAKSLELLGQTFADYSHNTALAVDTRAESVVDDSVAIEAEAIRQFIHEQGLENIVLVGNSLGGVQAIHLTALLQERSPDVNVEGLVLLDSMSLYDQTGVELAVNYTRDMLNTKMALRHPPQMKGREELAVQNSKYLKDGVVETLKEVMRSHVHYPSRTINEIKSMVSANPHLGEIKAPIVMIQGAHDLLSHPAKIIPAQNIDTPHDPSYIQDVHEREQFLQENVFTSSPYIRMIVPEKMGHHNLSYSRPQSVAQSSLYLLERWHRQQPNTESSTDPR